MSTTSIILSSRLSDLWVVVSVLLLGKFVSLIFALGSFTSSLTANLGANSPFTLGLFGYLALTIVNGSILLYQRRRLIIPWYWYVLLAFFDVQGNYLCLCLLFLSDAGVGGGGGSNILLGDLLVIGGTLFFALANVGLEYCAKNIGIVEVLAMLGAFGMLFSVIQIAIVERQSLEAIKWSAELILTFFGYTVGFFMFYTFNTSYAKDPSGSTLFNLSLLTADMWAVVIRVFFYHQQVDWLYYVSVLIVGVGVFIYSKSDKNHDLASEPANGIPYQLVDEQSVDSQVETA